MPRAVRTAAIIAAAALALVPTAAAARTQVPPGLRDTVTATGDTAIPGGLGASAIDVDASSGPGGENPEGTASFSIHGMPTSDSVSCLEVTGNVAIAEVDGPVLSVPGAFSILIRMTDNGGDGADQFDWYPVLPEVGRDFDCETGAPGWFGGPLVGRAIVREAPPGPASRRACRHGKWADYGFRSRRHCFRYVQRSKERPA